MEIGYSIGNEIANDIKDLLMKCGIMHRIFYRGKSVESLKHKIEKTPSKYSSTGKKIQDGFGVRIVLYFLEDVKTIKEILLNESPLNDKFEDISDSEAEYRDTHQKLKMEGYNVPSYAGVFQPQRLNFIFKMSEDRALAYKEDLRTALEEFPGFVDLIDTTFELQVRSVLSEGWHEVEHDMRYKCSKEAFWEYCEDESRALNGIYAALETQEYAMERLFEKMAYMNYKRMDWEPMIRNHFRLQMDPYAKLNLELKNLFNDDTRMAKALLTTDRKNLQIALINMKRRIPLNYDNIVYLCNRLSQNPIDKILNLEPKIIKETFNSSKVGRTS